MIMRRYILVTDLVSWPLLELFPWFKKGYNKLMENANKKGDNCGPGSPNRQPHIALTIAAISV